MLNDRRRERERQVLCSLLLDEFAYRELPKEFEGACFEDPEHEEIFEMLKREFIDVSRPVQISEINDHQLREMILSRITNPPSSLNGQLREAAYTLMEHDRLEDLPLLVPVSSVNGSHFPQLTGADIQNILDITIKYDQENKLICFLVMLSAYSEDSQLNLLFNAPASTGKSYIPTEIASLFPQEDVIRLAVASPTAFFHSGKFDKDREVYIVDLERKILIFLDQPHDLLLQRLRSFLSHDDRILTHKITDKTQKSGTRTKEIQLKGFASVVFCSAALKMDEQESTRCFLLSPETNQEKIRAGVTQKLKKEADPEMFSFQIEAGPGRRLLKARIRAIRDAHITEIRIPEYERELLERNILKGGMLKPRAQRDAMRIVSLAKLFALLNLWYRGLDGSTIMVNTDDVNAALELWDKISESQELGLPPYLYQFFKEIIFRAFNEKNAGAIAQEIPTGLSRKDILQAHLRFYGRPLSMDKLRLEILPQLEASGLISQEQDPENKRSKLVYPTPSTAISPQVEEF